jgi:hypothetical protein
MLLNHFTQEMVETIAPTDSRLRQDQRLFEEGKDKEADSEKIKLEVKQRETRKIREKNNEPIESPLFFEKTEIKNMMTGKM